MEPDGYQFPQMGKTRVSFLHRPTRRRRVSEAYLLFGKRNTRLFSSTLMPPAHSCHNRSNASS